MMPLSRRSLFGGFAGLLVAPAIVKASSLMAVKPLPGISFVLEYDESIGRFEAPGEWRRFGHFRNDMMLTGGAVLMVATDPTRTERVIRHGLAIDVPKELARVSVPIRWEDREKTPPGA